MRHQCRLLQVSSEKTIRVFTGESWNLISTFNAVDGERYVVVVLQHLLLVLAQFFPIHQRTVRTYVVQHRLVHTRNQLLFTV